MISNLGGPFISIQYKTATVHDISVELFVQTFCVIVPYSSVVNRNHLKENIHAYVQPDDRAVLYSSVF